MNYYINRLNQIGLVIFAKNVLKKMKHLLVVENAILIYVPNVYSKMKTWK